MAIAVLARRAEGNADLMEIQRDYVGLRGEICSPLKYRASLRNGVGPKLRAWGPWRSWALFRPVAGRVRLRWQQDELE
jgi:hypothetical protein